LQDQRQLFHQTNSSLFPVFEIRIKYYFHEGYPCPIQVNQTPNNKSINSYFNHKQQQQQFVIPLVLFVTCLHPERPEHEDSSHYLALAELVLSSTSHNKASCAPSDYTPRTSTHHYSQSLSSAEGFGSQSSKKL
jgi:hypothetical protein